MSNQNDNFKLPFNSIILQSRELKSVSTGKFVFTKETVLRLFWVCDSWMCFCAYRCLRHRVYIVAKIYKIKDLTMQNLENNDFVHSETLSAFLSREKLQKIDGKYKPNHNQLKSLVCYDEVNLGEIDTSEITSFRELFKNSTRRDFSGIDSWDTSKVTTFMSCFENAVYFNENINAWNVSNGTNFMQMFYNAKSFNQPLDGWKMSSATNTIRMFFQAKEFNQNIESWDMSNVVWAWEMFRGAENFNSPLNKWNVSSVTKMQGMFLRTESFNQSLDKWNVSNVVDMQGIFSGAQSFNQDLSAWGDKPGKVRNAKRAFADTKSLTKDFLKDWKFSSFCDKENIIKGSLQNGISCYV